MRRAGATRATGLLAGLLALAGCDGGGDATATPSPTLTVTATETEDPSPVPAETVTLEPEPDGGSCEDLRETGAALAFLIVEQPAPGTPVANPFTVRGCANAFEAAFQWELVSRFDGVLASSFESATCGSGCVGTFEFEVEHAVDELQVATLRVFTTSAEDGSVQDLNAIPVIVSP